jgi:predicted CopG family antitoxin
MKTTIQVDKKVKDQLESMKVHPQESYNEIIERLISISVDEQELSEETLNNIEKSLDAVRQGKVLTSKQFKERFNLK